MGYWDVFPRDRLPPRIEWASDEGNLSKREFGPINGIDVRRFRVKSDDVRLLIVRHRKHESGLGESEGDRVGKVSTQLLFRISIKP